MAIYNQQLFGGGGTYQSKTATPSTSQQLIEPDSGYDALSSVLIEPTPLESKTVTPSSEQQIIIPDSPNIGLSSVTVEAMPTEPQEKDVNFYAPNGELLYSYTKEEALALTSLPPSPSKTGLTFQAWDWTLSEIQSYVTDYGCCDIGATFITDDNKSRVYMTIFNSSQLSLTLRMSIYYGALTVMCGETVLATVDNTSTTYTAYNIPITIPTPSSYPSNIVLKFSFNNHANYGYYNFGDFSAFSTNGTFIVDANSAMALVKKVELGKDVKGLLAYSFYNCYGLEELVIPYDVISIDMYALYGCVSLKALVLPEYLRNINTYSLYSLVSLKVICFSGKTNGLATNCIGTCYTKRLLIPSGVTILQSYVLNNIYSEKLILPKRLTRLDTSSIISYRIRYIKIYKSVSSIGNQVLSGSYSLVVDLTDYDDPSAIPTIEANTFFSSIGIIFLVLNSTMKTAFESGTNWSNWLGHFKIEE